MKISIVTPSFNQDQYIERTIKSIITQKGNFDLEYIIMDWWSTDNTINIIKRIEKDLKNWEIKKQCNHLDFIRRSEKDKGQSDAINKWLKLATWDILTYINSDDTYKPGCLNIIAKKLWTSNKMRNYGKCHIIDENDKKIRWRITRYKNLLGKKYSYKKLLSENFISQMTVFWKKEITKDLGFFDKKEHLCMDYEYRLRIWSKHDPLYINEYLANFRFYHTSKSGSTFKKQFKDELKLAKKYAKWKYKISLFIHKINYYKIVWIYNILSFLKK